MNIHHNARLTFRGRELLVKRIVEQGLRVEEAAQASGVSVRTAYKWLRRYRQEGITGLYDRSSRPRHCPHQTSAHRHQEIVRLRRLRRTYRQISRQLGVSQSTVGRVLQIQTALREWAYARSYRNSSQRARELPRWMHYYNWHRQHAGIDYQCPINTLRINMNNLLALHS